MRKGIGFLLIFSILLMFPLWAYGESGAFLIMDGRSGTVLEQENGEERLLMASTTKVMTALVVLETVGLTETVEIPAEAAGVEGSSLYVKAGERYTVEDLLYGLMLRSANDCAVALAWFAGGGDVAAFVAMMNQKTADLGLVDTHFSDPSGLADENHYTTARELGLIMAAAMENEQFRIITATKRRTIGTQEVVNHNRLLSLYEDCIGGKTGYTMAAGRCLVTAAQRDGGLLICVTLGRRNDWTIHTRAYEKWFSTLETVVLAGQASFSVELPLADGGTVLAVNSQRVAAPVFQYDGGAESRVKRTGPFIYGNREAGTVAGTVEYWYQGVKIGESPLVLMESVESVEKKEGFLEGIFGFFRRLFLKKG